MFEAIGTKALKVTLALLACVVVFTMFLIFGGTAISLIIALATSLTVIVLTVKFAKRYLLVSN